MMKYLLALLLPFILLACDKNEQTVEKLRKPDASGQSPAELYVKAIQLEADTRVWMERLEADYEWGEHNLGYTDTQRATRQEQIATAKSRLEGRVRDKDVARSKFMDGNPEKQVIEKIAAFSGKLAHAREQYLEVSQMSGNNHPRKAEISTEWEELSNMPPSLVVYGPR